MERFGAVFHKSWISCQAFKVHHDLSGLSGSAVPEERRGSALLLGDLCYARDPCEQRHFRLPRASFTYLSVRYCEIYARAIQGRFLLGCA